MKKLVFIGFFLFYKQNLKIRLILGFLLTKEWDNGILSTDDVSTLQSRVLTKKSKQVKG